MRFLRYRLDGHEGLGIVDGSIARGLIEADDRFPASLASMLAQGRDLAAAAALLRAGAEIDLAKIEYLPPLGAGRKFMCLGVNYVDHARESGLDTPPSPTIFARYASSLIGHRSPIVRPRVSDELDYEGELVAIVGKGGRHILEVDALDHIAGYSVFNDASVRDFQLATPQWTVGKNFDSTGAFGPYFVTADELPAGGKGLRLETRLNGKIVQQASTADMVFDVAKTVAFLSQAMTLEAGDVLVMGTPFGIGYARDPKLLMVPGDVCEVEIEGIGTLVNPVVDESSQRS